MKNLIYCRRLFSELLYVYLFAVIFSPSALASAEAAVSIRSGHYGQLEDAVDSRKTVDANNDSASEIQSVDNKGLQDSPEPQAVDLQRSISQDTIIADTLLSRTYDPTDPVSLPIDTLNRSAPMGDETLLDKILQENDSLHAELSLVNKNTADLPAYITQSSRYYRDRWGLGYEEGPALRFRINNLKEPQRRSTGLTLGIGYQINQLKDQYHQALHEYHLRIGLYQECAVFSRVRIAAYFDAMEKMMHREAEPLLFETRYNRYALWITKLRAGVQINLFSLEHFLLTYRFGFEFAYCTPPYILNESKTTFLQYGKGIFRYGISGSDQSALEMIINNIGIYIYF